MSPRRSEKDLSEWEKFERERNNTLAAFDSRYRRFGGGTSGLGGYSPRRRRSEAAIKTPSPPPRSPERRKPRAWDLPPPGMDRSMVAAISAAHQAAAQAAIQHAAAVASVTPLVSGSVHLSPGATSASASCGLTPAPTMIPSLLHQVNPAVTAVTLTQATRALRRLYVGNVPATVSDGELLEFMNAAMLSANANHLAGTKPCINCSVNVDKSYAFAEFITPEDATAALAFDGVTLHGTTLKIRRPKDFAQPANGGAENASPILDMVSSTVADSPRKVFVGGISSSLPSEKVKEIVTAFGQLKAYHWEVDRTKQPSQAYAFLEYMDPTATSKACAGLNGMKLGTSFLTVVQATPHSSLEVDYTAVPSYRVPEHARPLLQAPSRILELQNMVTEDELRLMSKQDLDEIIEDIRLECSRFGNVKSMHIVQFQRPHYHGTEKVTSCSREGCEDPGNEGRYPTGSAPMEQVVAPVEQSALSVGDTPADGSRSENLRSFPSQETGGSCHEQADEENRNTTSEVLCYGQITKISGDESRCSGIFCCKTISTDTSRAQIPNTMTTLEDFDGESSHFMATSGSKPVKDVEGDTPSELVERSTGSARIGPTKEGSDASPREGSFLNVGKVYVEFSREESACQAAHALHGRTFAGRKVLVSYFPLKVYQTKFHKGLGPRTYEEKQALALAVQGHLTAHIKD
ncbi:hypothetical protein Mapa_016030 [Marchantia paleacea]|nr:hypothetical protein Mapa_016030 [Marchantia paleacea]